jgi:TolA-binding protein
MKIVLLLFTLVFLVSCSSTQEKTKLVDKIHAEEARSFQEIKSHTEFLLDNHPELNIKTKNELRSLLHITINRHQDLKDQESKIIQLLLKNSLRVNQLTEQELNDKSILKLQLTEVYEQKSNNILSLIKRIIDLSMQNAINEELGNDLMIFMRDFR